MFFVPRIVTFTLALDGGPGTANSPEVNADFTVVFKLVNAGGTDISEQVRKFFFFLKKRVQI